jgi:hypothetical protein
MNKSTIDTVLRYDVFVLAMVFSAAMLSLNFLLDRYRGASYDPTAQFLSPATQDVSGCK